MLGDIKGASFASSQAYPSSPVSGAVIFKLLNVEGVAGIFGGTVSSEIPHFFVSETRHPLEMLGAFFPIFPKRKQMQGRKPAALEGFLPGLGAYFSAGQG